MQEFHNCLKAEGITSTLYKANGALKEKFTYQVMDNDGNSIRSGQTNLEQTILENLLKGHLFLTAINGH